jgi:hypothetical protein
MAYNKAPKRTSRFGSYNEQTSRKASRFGSYTDQIYINDNENDEYQGDEDSMTELGQIALLSSSKASLRYRSLNEVNMSRRGSVMSRKSKEMRSSKLLLNNQQLSEEEKLKQKQSTDVKEEEELVDDVYVDDEPLGFFEKCALVLLPYKGYLFGTMSAFSFSLSQVTMKRAKWFTGSDHSLVRYLVTLLVMFTVLKYKGLSIFGPKKLLKIFLFRGFAGKSYFLSNLQFKHTFESNILTHTKCL